MGKLVPQDPNDEPASVLLERIKAEKRNKNGKKIKNSHSSSTVIEDEVIFKIPEGWEFDRLGNIAQTITKGSTPTSYGYYFQEEGIRFIKVENVKNGRIVIENIKDFISEEAHEFQSRSKLESGDILFSIAGTIGETCVVQDQDLPANTNQALAIIRGTNIVFDSSYLKVQFDSFVSNAVKSKARGGAMNNISLGDLKDLVVFIPPLAEQKRIVAKVDELLALCYKLEARRQKKQEIQSKLNSAALDRMLSAENQEEFEQYWQRICENFDLLYDNPENVEKLKQAILQLAVQGKFVPQNPEDEPASVLIEKIEAEKRQLVKEGKIQKTKELQSVDIEEIPYSIPDGWIWTRFGNIAPYIEAGWSPMCEKRPKEGDEWGVLKISAVSWNAFNPSENKALPSNLKPRPEYEVKLNDFLMSRANTSELVGKSVIVEEIIPKLMICDKVLRLFFSSFASKKYYNIFNNSQTARFYYAKEASGTSSSMKNISREVIYNMPVPLPPLEEQKRIVEKVEQFMGLCDELESKLRKSRENSEILMETVVRGLLEGASAEI